MRTWLPRGFEARTETEVKRSRFLATLARVDDEQQARDVIALLEDHHAVALLREPTGDDGPREPRPSDADLHLVPFRSIGYPFHESGQGLCGGGHWARIIRMFNHAISPVICCSCDAHPPDPQRWSTGAHSSVGSQS